MSRFERISSIAIAAMFGAFLGAGVQSIGFGISAAGLLAIIVYHTMPEEEN